MADECEHELSEHCWCHPTTIPVRRDDGSIGWVYAHHEPGPVDPADEVERWIKISEAIHIVRNQTSEEY